MVPDAVTGALRCRECGEPLVSVDDGFACPDGHWRLRQVRFDSGLASFIAELVDVDSGDRLWLKRPVEAPRRLPGEPQPLGEAAVLEMLLPVFADGPHRVARVVSGGAADGAILMHDVEAESLGWQLGSRDVWTQPARYGRAFAETGRWLSAFASGTSAGSRPFDPQTLVTRTESFLSELRGMAYPERKLDEWRRAFDAAAEEAAGTELQRCLVHGDLHLSHVFLGASGELTVIDFEQAAEGWAHEDAAFFLGGIDVMAARRPLGAYSRTFCRAPADFLAGYLEDAPPGWQRVGRFMCIASSIRWLMMECGGDLAERHPLAFRLLVLPRYERVLRSAARAYGARSTPR